MLTVYLKYRWSTEKKQVYIIIRCNKISVKKFEVLIPSICQSLKENEGFISINRLIWCENKTFEMG